MNIDSVTTDVGPDDSSDRLASAAIPDLDVLVPTSGHYDVLILSIKLAAENSVGVTWVAGTTSLKCNLELACLFIIDPHNAV